MARFITRMLMSLCVAATCLSGAQQAVAARVPQYLKLSIESEQIYQGDVIVLEVRHTGLQDEVDYAVLNTIGTIERETVGTMIAVISGKVVEIRLRRIELVPHNTGIVVIGPLHAGKVRSNSVSVKVLEPVDSDWQPGDRDIRASMRVSTTDPYRQQQLILDIELRHRYPIASESFELPDLSAFQVIERYAARRPAALSDDNWRTITWRYLLFASTSGVSQIAPFRARGSMIKSRRERGEFFVQSEPVNLNVRAARTDGWWLPASALRMQESWSRDKRGLAAGDETVRTISVTANGVTAAQIPDIQMLPTRGLRITPLQIRRQTDVTDDGASARVEFPFRIRAISPIPVFPDTIRLDWWDTIQDRARLAIVPAQRIQIGMPDRQALIDAFGEQQTWRERIAAIGEIAPRRWIFPVAAFVLLAALLAAMVSMATSAGIGPFARRAQNLPEL